jgi:hypothetical protein
VAAAKQTAAPDEYVNIREWRWFDDKTLKNYFFVPGDPYTGPLNLPGLLTPEGPDGKGPLIAKVAVPAVGAPDSNPTAASGEEK